VFNKPVKRVQTYETSALGAAMSTFMATGVYKDEYETVEAMVHYTQTFTPNPENVKLYDNIYKNVYIKLYNKLQQFYLTIDKEEK
jgi:sugar (pentulose or hexulose) kinase